ncbi:T9SS type A sorting domain-containing protein [Tenacibaculum tangerinum]|uniref:T9SS type A sorting domain-containing protein n=1 Tax=Tenacibaculum tangerinum TaxID=3038772 RepID=A0ABY8L8G1_9FLAO|nr:T9SS type A sorting domain-containing protein [Tenacibaculum tangerinum]WGH76530.1 T9SS type A sorting domain-containing protein [Tenacibaculum tangerinum]
MIKKLLFIAFFLVISVGFSQEKSIEKLSASPNPFTNSTTIYFNAKHNQTVLLTVRNVLGKTVFSKEIKVISGRNSFPFQRNDLKSGMYIYAVQSNKEIISKRFVIK